MVITLAATLFLQATAWTRISCDSHWVCISRPKGHFICMSVAGRRKVIDLSSMGEDLFGAQMVPYGDRFYIVAHHRILVYAGGQARASKIDAELPGPYYIVNQGDFRGLIMSGYANYDLGRLKGASLVKLTGPVVSVGRGGYVETKSGYLNYDKPGFLYPKDAPGVLMCNSGSYLYCQRHDHRWDAIRIGSWKPKTIVGLTTGKNPETMELPNGMLVLDQAEPNADGVKCRVIRVRGGSVQSRAVTRVDSSRPVSIVRSKRVTCLLGVIGGRTDMVVVDNNSGKPVGVHVRLAGGFVGFGNAACILNGKLYYGCSDGQVRTRALEGFL